VHTSHKASMEQRSPKPQLLTSNHRGNYESQSLYLVDKLKVMDTLNNRLFNHSHFFLTFRNSSSYFTIVTFRAQCLSRGVRAIITSRTYLGGNCTGGTVLCYDSHDLRKYPEKDLLNLQACILDGPSQ
jgi:hypothetical protein